VRSGLLGAMLEAVKREFALARGLLVRVMPPADPGHEGVWLKALAATGFRKHRDVPHPERYLVDLRLPADEQMKSLNAKWRANLTKAQRAGVEVREVDPRRGLDEFMGLYRAMAERKRFDDRHGLDHLRAALSADPAPPVRMFLAAHGGETVAGSVVVGAGERLSVPFSATGPRALELRAGYAMRWALMDRLRPSGASWLDLGGHEGDDGLRHFKEGNVGKRGVTLAMPGEYDFCVSRTSAAATSAIELARTAMDAPAMRHLLHAR
jgi:lipid II:glycine glycyltransferase (peptidoglycan interpeptide bridge formation enzyme)